MRIPFLAVLAGFAGCALPPPPAPSPPLICGNEAECSVMWRAAQVWIAQTSRFPVTIATDSIIQTAQPRGVEAYYAFQVTKRPVGGGREYIELTITCANLFGCAGGSPDSVRAEFKQEIAAAAQKQ